MGGTATASVSSGQSPAARRYHDEGYLIVRGLFSPKEMEAVSMDAERLLGRTDLISSRNLRCRYQPGCGEGGCVFETFDPVIDLSPACASLASDPRLLAVLADLYGESASLFKDKLIFKPPSARGYDLHQDFIAWPGFPRSFLTAMIAIDSCGLHNGCTVVYPGRHKDGLLSPEDGEYHPLPASCVAGTDPVPLELRPGDVAFFGCLMPHESAVNSSGDWRRMLYLSYNAGSDGDLRDSHYRHFVSWLKTKYADYGKTDTYFA